MNRIVLIVFLYIYILWIRFYLIKKKEHSEGHFSNFSCLLQQTGFYNLQTCLSMILLAMSMVMSGTGNLKVLQLCRFFHKRTGGEMNYGFHMAHHMALGLLFLGGGRWGGRWNAPVLLPHFISFFVLSHLRNSCRELSFSRFLFFQHRQPFPKLKHHPINKVMWHAAVSNQQFFLITL